MVNLGRSFINQLPGFAGYFYDPRAFILYVIMLILWMTFIYYKHEVRFLELALENKRDLAMELPKIIEGCPTNHYLGLIIGKLGETALNVKDRRGPDIIRSIDKNIKKYERVYWISEDEIGIIFYELKNKDESAFINTVLKNKLRIEIGEADASQFLDDIGFAMVNIAENEELYDIESRAKRKLIVMQNKMTEDQKQKLPASEGITNA